MISYVSLSLNSFTLTMIIPSILLWSAGGPGSGKGMQCDKIVQDFGYLHLSAGDLLRDEVKNGTKIGRECEQLMKDGKLVPLK